MDLETIQTDTTTYRVTPDGKPLAGKLFGRKPASAHMATPKGIGRAPKETADKYRARVLADIATNKTGAVPSARIVGRTDGPWQLLATDGHRAAFGPIADDAGEKLANPIATADRPVSFAASADLWAAVKRARVVSLPRRVVYLAVTAGRVVVSGDDGDGSSSDETVTVATTGAPAGKPATIALNADYFLAMFGRPDLFEIAPDTGTNLATVAADCDGWRYVLAAVRK